MNFVMKKAFWFGRILCLLVLCIPPLEDLRMNIQAEAIYNVKRLRNHPSIAIWCGNNEIATFMNSAYWGQLQAPFKSAKDAASIVNTYAEIFHNILPAAVKAYDSDKFYWSSSPTNENFVMKTNYTNTTGDAHYWGVWWGKEPFEKYADNIAPFMSEYGFQSFPELETVKTYAIPADYDINSEVMNAHQRSTIGNVTISHYMKDWFKIPAKFENFLYVGQVLQGEGIKIAMEAHRRAKPFCMGSLFWQIDDCWPVASWSSMDYYGRWKAQQYMVKKAFADFLVSPVKVKDSIQIYAVSDVYKPVQATLQISLIDFNGKILKNESKVVDLPENCSNLVYSFKEMDWVSNETRKNLVLNVKLIVNKLEVSQNNYYFEKPKDLNLSKTKIDVKQINANTIELSSAKLAKNVWLLLPGTNNAFSDNYFDLLPGEKKLIEVKAKDLKPVIGKIQIKSISDTY